MYEVVEINLTAKGNLVIPKNNKIALIDADTLVFASCCVCEEAIEIMPEDFYTENEWKDIITNPNYDTEKSILYTTDIDRIKEIADNKIKEILEMTGCSDYELHFTIGKKSFRYSISNTYKLNRLKGRVPLGLAEVKQMYIKEGATADKQFEADDTVIAKYKAFPDKYILCAVDKDVLYSIPGKHFNYYQNSTISMRFIDVDNRTAMLHPYRQTLTGDGSDNIEGLKRVGNKTADKILKDIDNEKEAWEAVINEYEKRGKDIIDALITMRLVNCNQAIYKDNKYILNLWRPPK